MSSGTTEWLSYTGPVPVDKSYSATGQRWSKYNQVSDVRNYITTLTIPTFSGSINGGISFAYTYIPLQFNYQASQPFSLLDFNSFFNQEAIDNAECYFAIRYYLASSGKTFRYMFPTSRTTPIVPSANNYSGELINPYFVIEVWTEPGAGVYNNPVPITLQTSIMSSPSPLADVISGPANYVPVETVSGDLFLPYLVPLPSTFPSDGPWVGN